MVTTLGTELGTILGTELGSLKDVYGFDTRLLYAISDISAANFFRTGDGGGEAGDAAGFGEIFLCRIRAVDSAAQQFLGSKRATGGWQVLLGTNGLLNTFMWTTSSTFVQAPGTFPNGKLGRICVVLVQHTGTTLRIVLDRLEALSSAAISGFFAASPATQWESWGVSHVNGEPSTKIDYLARLAFRGVPSDQQLIALLDQARTLRDLPPTFPQGSATDEDIVALAPRHWYRGDGYVPSGGNLGGLTNRNTTVGGQLNVTAGTVALPAADAALNGQLSVALTGTQWLDSDSPAVDFGFLHNGSGGAIVLIGVSTSDTASIPIATQSGGNGVGMQLTLNAGAGQYVVRDGAQIMVNSASVAGMFPLNTPSFAVLSYKENVSPEWAMHVRESVRLTGTSLINPTLSTPTIPLRIGAQGGGGAPTSMRITDVMVFDYVPSEAQLQTIRDYIRVRYGVGAITTTHRWSLRDVLRGLSLPVTDGQTAPASLPDTITAATIDRMDRQGSPTVKLIDPSVDGRKTYGSLGHSATAYWQTAGVGGIAGVDTGWNLHVWVRPELLTGTRIWLGRGVGTLGYTVQLSGASLVVVPSNGAGAAAPGATKTISAGELSQPHLLSFVHTGAGNQTKTYWDGVLVGTAACVGYTPQAGPMYIGCYSAGQLPASGESIFAVGGGHAIHSDADIAAIYANVLRTGTLQRATGMDHLWDWTADIIANGGPENGVPLTVLDRIGTDHITRVGGIRVNSAGGIAGLTKWAPANVAATRAGGGLAGVGTGFFRAFDLILGPYTTTNGIFGKSDGGNNGDYFRITTSGLQWVVGDGGAVARSAILPLVAGDVTTRQRCVIQHDGANIRIYLGTTSNTISVACAGHTPYAAGPMSLGDILPNGASAQGTSTIYGMQSGQAILTAGEISALLADTTFAPVAGKTTYRVWIPDDVAEAGGKVPVILKERISGTDNMVITGAPLQVAQRVERLWSYEAA